MKLWEKTLLLLVFSFWFVTIVVLIKNKIKMIIIFDSLCLWDLGWESGLFSFFLPVASGYWELALNCSSAILWKRERAPWRKVYELYSWRWTSRCHHHRLVSTVGSSRCLLCNLSIVDCILIHGFSVRYLGSVLV